MGGGLFAVRGPGGSIGGDIQINYGTFESNQSLGSTNVLLNGTLNSAADLVTLSDTDAPLSGTVDFDTDYHQWRSGFESAGAPTGWVWGDFDHNGVVDFGTDYHLSQTAFEAGAGTTLALPTDPGNTPEPGTLVLLTLGAVALLRKRRVTK